MTDARLYLREWRKARRMTQQQLAAASGVLQSKISELEKGRAKLWSPVTLGKLAGALKVAPWQLLRPPK